MAAGTLTKDPGQPFKLQKINFLYEDFFQPSNSLLLETKVIKSAERYYQILSRPDRQGLIVPILEVQSGGTISTLIFISGKIDRTENLDKYKC